jgi:hypothetical protein
MTQQHPITPPPELVKQWIEDWYRSKVKHTDIYSFLAIRAAQWGADQELEACCEWVDSFQNKFIHVHDLRLVRRPKPSSLKEQALKELTWVDKHLNMPLHNHCTAIHTIRRALEQLPDNE